MLKRFTGKRTFHAHETARMDALDGLPLASFKQRGLALLLDFIVIAVVKAPFHYLFRNHGGGESHEAGMLGVMEFVVKQVETLVESTFYFAVALKMMHGQTPGKKWMKIRVVSLTHGEIGWWQSIERALGYGASFLEGGFGFVQYYIHRNRQCVHDRIAETIVVDVVPRLADEKLAREQDQEAEGAAE